MYTYIRSIYRFRKDAVVFVIVYGIILYIVLGIALNREKKKLAKRLCKVFLPINRHTAVHNNIYLYIYIDGLGETETEQLPSLDLTLSRRGSTNPPSVRRLFFIYHIVNFFFFLSPIESERNLLRRGLRTTAGRNDVLARLHSAEHVHDRQPLKLLQMIMHIVTTTTQGSSLETAMMIIIHSNIIII